MHRADRRLGQVYSSTARHGQEVAGGDAGQKVQADQPGHVVGPRAPSHIQWRAHLDNPAVLDDHQSISEHRRIDGVVSDHNSWASELGQMSSQLSPDQQPSPGVERCQRLVQQEKPGVAGQRPSQRDSLRLATGDRSRLRGGDICNAHPLQPVGGDRTGRMC